MAKWTAQSAYQMHRTLVQHTADAPNRYRVLVPVLVESFSRLMPSVVQPQLRFLGGYFIYYQGSVAFSLMLLFIYLRQWYACPQALVGILVVAMSMLVAFGDGYFQPWSLLEIGLFTAGLLAIYKSQRMLLAGIIGLATLNRETGVFLVITYLLINLKRETRFLARSHLIWTGIYSAIWGSIFIGVRLWLGATPQLSLMQILQMNFNLGALLMTGVNGVLFLGAYWILVWKGYKVSHPFIRTTWRIVPVYLIAVLIFGLWPEVRLLTLLYPILISTGLEVWDMTA